ncbi:hypothetical protein PAXINDRAFT_20122 [Paxillus involutus ATCC 200175]|uniref:Uncharacterized protein n=1 Tax=Paxillus involutus ATCC 200175 TaxID=664439 RepID=A0A0C9THB8_PAXIN|nr:hypothetical protein PAXINDRAFT_20122 [Paxillus involutus ATCC 200175]
MRIKLERELGINISDMEWALFKDDADVDDTPATPEGNDSREPLTQEPSIDPSLRDNSLGPLADNTAGSDTDADGIPDPENPSGDADELDETDSGFGLVSGKPMRFNSSKFWNYVDYMLNLLHESMHKDATSKEDYEKAISR